MNTIEKALSKQQHLKGQKKPAPVLSDSSSELDKSDSTHILDKLADRQIQSDLNASVSADTEKKASIHNSNKNKANKKKSKNIDLDLERLDNLGYLVPNHSNTILNEEYRQIKRPLLNNLKGKSAHPIKNANVIQVTSSVQSEGKSFTALNLALSFAVELDLNVLLVDADTIKSSLTKTLLNTHELGLNDYLHGDVKDLSEVMMTTNIPKLSILPSGTRHKHSTELFNSNYMETLISEFSGRYENRIVIFDSPPLLQTNDARILSQKVGQLVFVVEQNKTEVSIVKDALELLDPEMVIGVVMNKSRSSSHSGYYGYYGSPQ